MGKQEEGGPEVGKGEKEGILEVTRVIYFSFFSEYYSVLSRILHIRIMTRMIFMNMLNFASLIHQISHKFFGKYIWVSLASSKALGF